MEEKFDVVGFIINELRISKVRYWTDKEGYHYRITIKNKDDEDASFVIDFDRLVDYKTALKIFSKYIGKPVKGLPKGAEEETWDKVVEVITAKSREGGRVIEEDERNLLDKFSTVWYYYDVLNVSNILYWFNEEGYFFEFEVVNDDNERVTFTIPFYKLADYKTALSIFAQYLGRIPIALPKGLEEEAWKMVLEDMKREGHRVRT